MIAGGIAEDLAEVVRDLDGVGTEHGKCLACHCYREVAGEALESLDALLGHGALLEEPLPVGFEEGGRRLRRLLGSSEGKHG